MVRISVTQKYLLCKLWWEREPGQKVNEYSATFKEGKNIQLHWTVCLVIFLCFLTQAASLNLNQQQAACGPTLVHGPHWEGWVRRVWAGRTGRTGRTCQHVMPSSLSRLSCLFVHFLNCPALPSMLNWMFTHISFSYPKGSFPLANNCLCPADPFIYPPSSGASCWQLPSSSVGPSASHVNQQLNSACKHPHPPFWNNVPWGFPFFHPAFELLPFLNHSTSWKGALDTVSSTVTWLPPPCLFAVWCQLSCPSVFSDLNLLKFPTTSDTLKSSFLEIPF